MERVTILFLFLILSIPGFTQLNGNLYHLDVTSGLSNGTVHTIFQDQEGLMWFGTTDGLNSYNGYDFKSYHYSKHDSNSISSSFVVNITEKSKDELWIATHSGLNIFRKKTDQFEVLKADPTDQKALSNGTIKDLVKEGNEFLWVATAWGLNKMSTTPPYPIIKRYFHDPHNLSLTNDHVNCLFLDGSDLWIGTNNGLSILNITSGKFRDLASTSLKTSSLTGNVVRDIMKDSEGSFWIGTENGANRYFVSQDSLVRFFPENKGSGSLGAKIVHKIFEDSDNNIWLGTDGAGVYRYDTQKKRFIPNKQNLHKPLSLSTNGIYSIYETKDHILWIGTYEKGVHYADKRKRKFHTYTHDPLHNSLSQSSVKAVVKSRLKNGLWLGTASEGVNYMDLETGTFEFLKHEEDNTNSLSTNVIKSLLEDKSGKIWVGTYTGGLNCYDPETGMITNYPYMPPNSAVQNSTHIWSLYEDKRGNFWIGTLRGGLVLFDPETNLYEHFTNNPLDTTSIASDLISVMYEDSRGNFWVGNEEESGGLNLMDRDAGTFRRFAHNPENSSSITHNFIREIYEDSNQQLWIGTSHGLNLFNYETETFSNFNHLEPLNGMVNNILEDDNGYLWISTNEGLVRFDPKSQEYTHFDASDGLQGNEFNYNSAIKLDDGRLFFGGLKGFNLFHPDEIVVEEPFPPVMLTNFKLKDQSIGPNNSSKLDRNINYTRSVTLNPDESSLSIEFAAINYYAPQKTRYAYKLEGLEKDWRYVGSERKASYTNLDPGSYTFHVKASNCFGEWGDNATSIQIRILPAWYETTLFKIFLLLLLGGGIFGFLQYRTKNLSQKKLLLQQMVKQRTAEIEELNTELANSNKSLQYINHTLTSQRNELKRAVAELKVTRDRLVISEKMASIGVFTAGIAHELNNPINYVSGATKLLCEIIDKHVQEGSITFDPEEFATIRELESTIQMGVEKTADIIKSLRNYVHEDTEEFKPFNLIYCIDDALKLLKSEYKDRISIRKDLPEEVMIECLPGRVNQIIVNLMSNAIDAIKAEGTISISAFATSQYSVLKIKDTGEGIPERMLAKLYDPFFTTKEVGKGMGLGLYIVYGLVDMHNGKISVKSVEGRGTEFTVELPLKQERQSQKETLEKVMTRQI